MAIIKCENCGVKIDTKTGKHIFDEKPIKGNQKMKGVTKDEKGRFKSKKEIREKTEKKEIENTTKEANEKKETTKEKSGSLDFLD